MPIFYTPGQPRYEMPDLKEIVENPGYASQARTLGELLIEFEECMGTRIEPHDPPKYFRYFDVGSLSNFILVDIHITRSGTEICPKQDLSFLLEPNDVVEAGVLVC